MAKQKVKAGIVGSGFAAKFHYEALQHFFSANVSITGAYSFSPANLAAFTEPGRLKYFNGPDELIQESDVCTPPVSHEAITETKEGWSSISPDESWFAGYQHEMNAFLSVNGYRAIPWKVIVVLVPLLLLPFTRAMFLQKKWKRNGNCHFIKIKIIALGMIHKQVVYSTCMACRAINGKQSACKIPGFEASTEALKTKNYLWK